MRRTITVVLAALVAGLIFTPAPAPCQYLCPDFPCYSTMSCGHGCLCLRVGTEITGRCVSLNVAHR